MGLAKTDALEACLSAVNADLIYIAFEMGSEIKQSYSAQSTTMNKMRKVETILDAYLRVTRQMDRLTQLELRAAARKQADHI